MKLRLTTTAIAVAAVFPMYVPTVVAQEALIEDVALSPVFVSATRIEILDVDATYASEVHTREDIQRSGATTLFDYLSRHTSLTVLPNFGNRFTPALDMRGYGIGSGHQNVAVSINGRRLNNIDMAPPLLGSISLADLERIEITKGSGSVINGDGAMAGAIRIFTRPRTGASLEAHTGSQGTRGLNASVGFAADMFSLAASAEKSQHGGSSEKDPSGFRDKSSLDAWSIRLSAEPVEPLSLTFDAGKSRIDTRYPASLTLAQFKDKPSQNPGRNYTQQDFRSDYWQLGAEIDLNPNLSLALSHSREDKTSEFSSGFSSDYDYRSTDVSLQYQRGGLGVTTGYQVFDGRRIGSDNKTDKDSEAWFVQGQYAFERLSVSAGWRTDRVAYAYHPRPNIGAGLKANERLLAWDLGLNYRFDDYWTAFANYNAAFQAPDIDRFFSRDWLTGVTSFNGFINPAKVKTVTFGLNHSTATHKLKVAVFHARLENEIYFKPVTFVNTNIDKSHKYGLEIQDTLQLSERVTGSLNYSWIRAIIDRENSGGGAYDGKNLPGVSRHSLIASLNVKVTENGRLNIAHTWRSKAYAANDFANNFSQKQKAYHSTDITYRHRVRDELELFAAVGNVFARKNGVWVRDNAIYPFDFERTWRVGASVAF